MAESVWVAVAFLGDGVNLGGGFILGGGDFSGDRSSTGY